MDPIRRTRFASNSSSQREVGKGKLSSTRRPQPDAHARGEPVIFRDEGISGRRWDRPGIQALIGAAGDFERVVVWKLDRVSRKACHALEIVELLDTAGAAFVSITEQFDTGTPMGRAMLTIMAAFAELEWDQISERQKLVQADRAMRGYQNGNPPMGYRRGADGAWEIDPAHASLVHELAERYAAGASWAELLT